MSRIAIISDNSINYVETLLKIWSDNDSAVLIDWRIPPQKVAKLLKDANVKSCYLESNKFNIFSNDLCVPTIEIKSSDGNVDLLPRNIVERMTPNYKRNEALVLFSSGTTGDSKGISLSHYAIQKNADAIIRYMKPTKNDGIYIVKALSHSSTIVGELLVGLKAKSNIYLASTIMSPKKTLENISKTQATILCTNPTLLSIYNMVLKEQKYDLSKLRKLYVSGSVLSPLQMQDARNVFNTSKIYNVYGLTEAGPRVCAQSNENYDIVGTVGKPIQDVSIKIVDKNNDELPVGKQGLIKVKTKTRFTSYINQETRNIKNKNDHYFSTGDLGYKDINGNIFIVGRYDDMIIKSSHNIYPESVEIEILKYPLIKECLVFGLNDVLYGEKVVCFFVSKEKNVNINDLRCFCLKRMATYEVPDMFVPVQNIPLTSGGKKSRELARSIMNEGII